MTHIEANDQNFIEIVEKSDIPVVVDFWAPWCAPCRMLTPIFENLSWKYEWKIKFVKVNVDINPQTAIKYMVQWIPTVMIFKEWHPIKTLVWVKPETEYINEINSILWIKEETKETQDNKNNDWIIQINWTSDFENALKNHEDKLIIADFWAPWCWPCRMIAPTLEKLVKEYKDKLVVIKINVDDPSNQELAMQFQVQSIPMIAFIQKGKQIEVTVWALPYETLKNIIEKKIG